MEKRTEAAWRELIADYKASGQSQAEWCKARNVNQYTFRDRLRKYRKTPEMVQAPVSQERQRTRETVKWQQIEQSENETTGRIEIKIGKFTIVTGVEADVAQLKKVCGVLMQLC